MTDISWEAVANMCDLCEGRRPHGTAAMLRALRAALTEAEARVKVLEERLEITHVNRFDEASGEMVRVELPPEDRLVFPDGVFCRDATIAELESQIEELVANRGWRVKPLEWRETDPGRCGASTALGDYRIDDNGPAWIFDRFYLLLIGGGAISVHPSKAEAQAAAQADYEARIAARIESAPVTVQEAARVLRDWADTAEWLHNTDYEAFTRQLRRALAGETP